MNGRKEGGPGGGETCHIKGRTTLSVTLTFKSKSKMKIKQIFKNIVSHILADELAKLNSDCEHYKKLAFGKKYVILPSSAVSCIVDILPNPNQVATGQLTTQQLLALNTPESIRRYTYVLQGQEHSSVIRIVADTRSDEEKQREQGLMIELIDFSVKVFIPLAHTKMTSVIGGVNSEVDTWTWDLYRAGIRIVDNADFNLIMEYIVAQHNPMGEV